MLAGLESAGAQRDRRPAVLVARGSSSAQRLGRQARRRAPPPLGRWPGATGRGARGRCRPACRCSGQRRRTRRHRARRPAAVLFGDRVGHLEPLRARRPRCRRRRCDRPVRVPRRRGPCCCCWPCPRPGRTPSAACAATSQSAASVMSSSRPDDALVARGVERLDGEARWRRRSASGPRPGAASQVNAESAVRGLELHPEEPAAHCCWSRKPRDVAGERAVGTRPGPRTTQACPMVLE